MFLRRLPAAVLVIAHILLALPASAQDSWIGLKVFAKEGAKPRSDMAPIDWKAIQYPVAVTSVDGEWLWVGRVWIKQTDVVTLDRAIPYFTEHIRKNPTSGFGYNGRGSARQELGDLNGALKDFNEAIRLEPSAATYNNRGTVWSDKRELDNALKDYTEAIRLDPRSATPYNNRGNIWVGKGELGNALKDYTEAIRLDPKNALAYGARGHAWEAKGELDNALKDYMEAIRLNPRFPAAYYYRAGVWEAKGELGNALKDYTEALRLDPKNPRRYNAIAWLRATSADASYRDGKVAIEHATKACELSDWKDTLYIATLAAAYAETGDYATATKWQKAAIDLLTDEKERAVFRGPLTLYEKKRPLREPSN